MIAQSDLRKTARSHLRAAQILYRSKSYDAAVYLCGYAVEIALKARICQTLKWTGFPSTTAEFQKKRGLQTHDLEALLEFTGIERRIKPMLATDWSLVTNWNPEQRYSPVGTQSQSDALNMIEAAKRIVEKLL